MIVVRELIGGLYFGTRKEQNVEPDLDTAWDTMIYSVSEVQRITRVAAQIALAADPPLEIHSIDKANVLASSRLWRKVVTETLKEEYPQLKFDHHLVDSAAMLIVSNPKRLNGVILTENLFGDMYVGSVNSYYIPTKPVSNTVSLINQASSPGLSASSLPRLLPVPPPFPPQTSSPHQGYTSLFTVQHPTSLDRALPTPLAQSSALPCSSATPWVWRSQPRRSRSLCARCWTRPSRAGMDSGRRIWVGRWGRRR